MNLHKKVKLITFRSQYYLISNEGNGKEGDTVFYFQMGERRKAKIFKIRSGVTIIDDGGVAQRTYGYEQIIATPDQIAMIYINNKMSCKGMVNFYVAEATKEDLRVIKFKNKGVCEIEMEGDVPKLIDNKVIICNL